MRVQPRYLSVSILVLSLIISVFLLTPRSEAISSAQDPVTPPVGPTGQERPGRFEQNSEPKPYDKVITKDAKSDEGVFTIHTINGTIIERFFLGFKTYTDYAAIQVRAKDQFSKDLRYLGAALLALFVFLLPVAWSISYTVENQSERMDARDLTDASEKSAVGTTEMTARRSSSSALVRHVFVRSASGAGVASAAAAASASGPS